MPPAQRRADSPIDDPLDLVASHRARTALVVDGAQPRGIHRGAATGVTPRGRGKR